MRKPVSDSPATKALCDGLGWRSAIARAAILRRLEKVGQSSASAPIEIAFQDWFAQLKQATGNPESLPISAQQAILRQFAPRLGGDAPRILFAVQGYVASVLHAIESQATTPTEAQTPILRDDGFAVLDDVETSRAVNSAVANWLREFQDEISAGVSDPLTAFLMRFFSQPIRHPLGEYYTPGWLADHLLDQVGFTGEEPARLLDPTCGSGAFLRQAILRLRAKQKIDPLSAPFRCQIVGLDLNPLAVCAARANVALALLGGKQPHLSVQVFHGDALNADAIHGEAKRSFTFVVGNPPWIAWDNLPTLARERAKPLFEAYGLFSLSGNEARHGGGKKDLAALLLYRSADLWLVDGGRLGFVLPKSLLFSKAGEGFRRFQIGPTGAKLAVERVDDFSSARAFGSAGLWATTLVLTKDRSTTYPVAYHVWSMRNTGELGSNQTHARPRGSASVSGWTLQEDTEAPLWSTGVLRCPYQAYLGANSAGANGVFWLESAVPTDTGLVRVRNLVTQRSRPTPTVSADIEPDRIYPLLRWRDVGRRSPQASAFLLLTQDPNTRTALPLETMVANFPRTLAYLQQFHEQLGQRAAYKRFQGRAPFYAMYNVGPYTLAPIKVVWRRMDTQINATVVEAIDAPGLGIRPIIPQETCVFVPVDHLDEAHFLCGFLNSEPINTIAKNSYVAGAKGFGSPGLLAGLPIVKFDAQISGHRELSRVNRLLFEDQHRSPTGDLERERDGLVALLVSNRRSD